MAFRPDHAPPRRRSGYQHHHLIPLALARRSQFEIFFAALAQHGFRISDRHSNCLWLPSQEALAWHSGAAMNRGPHPRYSDVVASRVDRIRLSSASLASRDLAHNALPRMERLQRTLAKVLTGSGPRLIQLNRRDPLHLFADYGVLDAAIADWESRRAPPTASPLNGSE